MVRELVRILEVVEGFGNGLIHRHPAAPADAEQGRQGVIIIERELQGLLPVGRIIVCSMRNSSLMLERAIRVWRRPLTLARKQQAPIRSRRLLRIRQRASVHARHRAGKLRPRRHRSPPRPMAPPLASAPGARSSLSGGGGGGAGCSACGGVRRLTAGAGHAEQVDVPGRPGMIATGPGGRKAL